MTWFAFLIGLVALAVLGLFFWPLWIVAVALLVVMVLYGIGLSRRSGLSRGAPHA